MNDLFYKAAFMIQDEQSFDEWEWDYQRDYDPKIIKGLGAVQVVEVIKPKEAHLNTYGEYPQGYEGEMTMVFEVDTSEGIVYVQKAGTMNSYGTESWDGKLSEVRKTTKTVTAFEKV